MLAGDIDASNVAELYEQFSDLMREGIQRISLHLAEVTFMDSYFTIRPVDHSLDGHAPMSPVGTPRREETTTAGSTYFDAGN